MKSSDSSPLDSKVWLPVLFALTLAVGLLVGMRINGSAPVIQNVSDANLSYHGQGRVDELLRYVEARYVEDQDQEKLTRVAMRAILDELDPHSSFIPVEDMQALMEQMEGNFDGIGIEFMMVEDTIVVVTPISGGPSEEVGILAGDKIVMIEDSLVAGRGDMEIDPTKLLRGPKGSEVNVQIKRAGRDELLPFTITRAAIPMHSVDAAYKIDDETAYIKVNRFSATTYQEFSTALKSLVEEQGVGNLVIDLRQNPGGYLEQATKMLSQFFPDRGKLLVYTEGTHTKRRDYNTNGRAFYRLDDIAVLIDEGSASASEIVAGAIQDHDRGIIIGRRSFGKGLVQEQYDLSDGSALRLTVSRYYTPSGRSIQKSYDEGEEVYHRDLDRRYQNGELDGSGNAEVDSTQLYFTDSGHPVYGGGGISPDVFVPLDSSFNGEAYLWMRQMIPAYVFTYAEQELSNKEYGSFAQFNARFNPGREVIQSLHQRAEAAAEKDLSDASPIQEQELLRFFKARIAKQLFGGDYFFQVYNQEDDMVNKALELLKKAEPMTAVRE
ncbi:MAG: S41 family peptidase [Bacteroidota bacterium]